jgi:hypothetical protein
MWFYTGLTIVALSMYLFRDTIEPLLGILIRRIGAEGLIQTATVPLLAFATAFGAVVLNVVPDYLSLCETRWIIGKVEKKTSVLRMLFLLLIDLILTAAIFTFLFSSIIAITAIICMIFGDVERCPILEVISSNFMAALHECWQHVQFRSTPNLMLPLGITPRPGGTQTAVFFYTTFATSVWVWLHIGSCIILRFGQRLRPPSSKLRRAFLKTRRIVLRLLDFERRPILCIGYVAVSLISLVYWVAEICGIP